MDDIKLLERYIESFKMIYMDAPESMMFVKDANLRYQFITNTMTGFLGLDDPKDILGKTSGEISVSSTPVLLEQWTKQDMIIKNSLKNKLFLEVAPCSGINKIFVVSKVPIVNLSTGNFIGIRGQIASLIVPHPIKTLLKMHGATGLLLGIKNRDNDLLKMYPLTNMQHAVLYLALNNYSYSEIASLLNTFGHEITSTRVNDYLEQLKFIFHVRNKIQLIEKAIGLNFHTLLPDKLFNREISLEITNQEAKLTSTDTVQQQMQ